MINDAMSGGLKVSATNLFIVDPPSISDSYYGRKYIVYHDDAYNMQEAKAPAKVPVHSSKSSAAGEFIYRISFTSFSNSASTVGFGSTLEVAPDL